MIENMHKNLLGTLSFEATFPGMRKRQNFICYPVTDEDTTEIKIQSDTRMGSIHLTSGWVTMSNAHPNGAYFHHLMLEGSKVHKLSAEDLFMLKAQIMATASGMAGNNGIVYCDNSGAAGVFK